MKQGVLVTVGGAAILVAGLAGCSGDKSSSSSSSSSASSATATASVSASVPGGQVEVGSGTAKVSIDGADQNVTGSVVCAPAGGNYVITVGQAGSGVVVTMTSGDSPKVNQIVFGSVGGGALTYSAGTGGEATVVKTDKNYKVTGTAMSVDLTNPGLPVNKPFEIDATCP